MTEKEIKLHYVINLFNFIMKKSLLAFATLLTMVACVNKTTTNVENEKNGEVPFEVASNYFYNHNVGIPSPKITTGEDFSRSESSEITGMPPSMRYAAMAAPSQVKCPWCGSMTSSASGKCQFCEGELG